MLAADEKQTALQTIQAVVTAIAQNHYAAIPTLLSRSDLPMEELQGEIERVLRFQKIKIMFDDHNGCTVFRSVR